MKTFLYILLLSFGFTATAQTIDDFSTTMPTTDNNMSPVFPAGTLSDYFGGILQVYVDGLPVSASSEIQADGSASSAAIGTDNLCACDLANVGEILEFAILMNSEVIIIIDVNPPVTYAANSFEWVSGSLSFTIDGAAVVFGCTDASYLEFDASANLDDDSCSLLVAEGCTDGAADNFDAAANTEDGSCLFTGCMDSSADNFDTQANVAGYCQFLGCTYDWACNYDSGANEDDGSCEGLVGCTDPAYYEFDENATCEDGSCVINLAAESFNSIQYSCGETITSYEYNNTQIYGLQEDDIIKLTFNVNLYNCYYDEFAYGDYYGDYYSYMYNNNIYAGIYIDNSLEYVFESSSDSEINELFLQGSNTITIIFTYYYPSYYLTNNDFNDYYGCQPFSMNIKKYDGTCYLDGCIDSTALNYFPQANIDDGACDYNGCTDPAAFNYNSEASIDHESCEFPTSLGNLECGLETLVSGATATNYGFENSVYYTFNLDDNAEMIFNLDGVSSMYDPYILIFDSTQTYLQTITYSQPYYIEDSVDFDAGQYFIVVTEDNPNFSSGTLSDYYTLMQNNYQNAGSFTLSLFTNDGICDFQGCTYDWAENYNEIAVIDNGSCYLNGCTSENANNYDPFATQDDTSCSYTNAVDFGLLECGETYFHENGYTTPSNFEYEFQLDTRSIVNIGYNEQGAYCLDYNYVGDCTSSSLGNNEFSISTFNSIINDWVILENIINNSFDLDSGLYKLSLYNESNFVEAYEIDITAENYCSLEIIEIGSLACGVDTFISGATTSTYGFENSAYYSFNVDNDTQMRINLDGSSGMYDPYILLFDSTQTYIQTIAYSQYYYINDYYLNLDAGEYFMVVTEDDPEFSNGTILEYAFAMNNNFQSTGAFTLNLFSYNGSCIEIIEGCVNNNYFEFNPLANMDTDPSSCSTLIVEGCMDSTAFNFSLLSNIDDNSCEQPTNLGILDCGADTLIYGATTSTYGFENSVYYTFKVDNDSEIIINLDGYSSMYDPYILLFDSTKNYVQTISYTATYYINDYSINLEAGQNYLVVTEDNPYFSDGTLSDYYSSIGNSSQGKGSFTLSLFTYDGICALHGCTNDWADNYDSLVTINNGSCTLEACMSDWADNYDSNATSDEGSCYLEACMSYWADNYDSNATSDDGSCYRMGCMSDWADNYDALATTNDGSCELVACMSDWADNYNVNATTDNGSCFKYGCINPTAFNYDTISTIDFSPTSCIIYGCLYNSFSNFNDLANTDDGSCSPFSEDVFGCIDETAFNFDSLANIDNGGCIEVVLGCTDELAINFDSLANTSHGSCETPTNIGTLDCGVTLSTGLDTISGSNSYETYNNPRVYEAYSFSIDTTSTVEISFDMNVLECDNDTFCYSIAYVFLFENNFLINFWIAMVEPTSGYSYNDIPSEINLATGSYTLIYGNENYNYWPSIGMGINEVISQTYTNSYNDNQDYTAQMELLVYDGTCYYWGCTDSAAFNFNPIATIDDGSCESPTNIGTLECGALIEQEGATTSTYGFENSEYYTFNLDNDAEIIINIHGYSSMYDPYILLFDSTKNYIQTVSYTQNYYINDYSINLESGQNYIVVTRGNPIFSSGTLSDYYTSMQNNYQNTGSFTLSLFTYDGICGYPGCVDSTAFNFNPNASIDDGSCESPTNIGTLECGALIEQEGATTSTSGFDNSTYYAFNLDNDAEIMINLDGYSSMYDPYILLFDSTKNYIQTISHTESYYINDYSINFEAGQNYIVVTEDNPNFSSGTLSDYYTSMQNNYQNTGSFTLSLFPYDGTCGYHGCTDTTAFNYNPIATVDDGSCEHQLDLGNIECNTVSLEDSLTNYSALKYYQFEVSEHSTFAFEVSGGVNIFLFDSTFNYMFKMDLDYNPIDLDHGVYQIILSKEEYISSYLYSVNIENLPTYSFVYSYELNIENLIINCSTGCNDTTAINFNQNVINFNNYVCHYPDTLGEINCDNNIISGSIQDNFGAFNSSYYYFELSDNSLYNFSIYSNSISSGISEPHFLLFNDDMEYILTVSPSSPYSIDEHSILLDIGGYYSVITNGYPGSNFTNLFEYFTDMKSNYQSSCDFTFEYSIIDSLCPEDDFLEFGESDFIAECGVVYNDTISIINGIQTYDIREFNITNDSTLVEFEFENENYWGFEHLPNEFNNNSILLFKNNELIYNFIPITNNYEYYYEYYYEIINTISKGVILNQGEYKIFIGGTYSPYESNFQTLESASNSYLDYYEYCHWTYQDWSYCGFCGTGCYPPVECMNFNNSDINISLTINDDSCDYYGCTDELAHNYSSWANVDNGECQYLGCIDPNYIEYNPNADIHDGSCQNLIILGCTDETAFNYSPLANTDDGSCIAVVLGCTDVTAFNYNELANTEDDSCIDVVLGCIDATAFNYNVLANTDDNDCIAVVEGCMDSTAFNYNAGANTDDGSCVAVALGCTDSLYTEFVASTNTDDGSCITLVVLGCTDMSALNYNELANTDDGSCIAVVYGCTDAPAFNYSPLANYDDGSCYPVIVGCMLDWADNYIQPTGDVLLDINTDDNNTCYKFGCMDSTALNYDSMATISNECIYTCPPPSNWEYETTGSNHTMMIPEDVTIDVNGQPLTQGSSIGVFYTNENGELQCAGYTQINGEQTFIAIMGDDSTTDEIDGFQEGEEIIWMVWDIETCQEYPINASYSMGSSVYSSNALTFLDALEHYTCQQVELPGGWFMYSSYIQAEDMDAELVMNSIVDNLVILKDNGGNAYLTEWDFNGIGELDFHYGYHIKTNTPDTLEICGLQMYPEDYPIALESGWNIISYLRESSSQADIVLEDLNSNDNLIIVKDYDGNPYLPEWDFNGIGNMSPGQGYQLKLYDADTLIYLSNNQEYRISTTQVVENKVAHFAKVTPTGNNMQIVIPESSWYLKPEIGSEIAAYTSDGVLVGSTKYSNPTTVLTLWGNDLTTKTIDGLLIDEPVVFKVWDKAQISDYKIENWSVGSNAYQVDAINVAAAVEIEGFNQTTNLFNAIPNPSQTKTNILFFVAEAGNVNISVYNVVGELVEVLANSVYKAGTHELEMQVSHIEAGSYFYTMRAEDFEKTKQLIILK